MSQLIVWLLALTGIVYFVISSVIFEKPRNFLHGILKYVHFHGVLECSTCFSFWAGIFMGAFGFPIMDIGGSFIEVVISGFAAMGFTSLLTWSPERGDVAPLANED